MKQWEIKILLGIVITKGFFFWEVELKNKHTNTTNTMTDHKQNKVQVRREVWKNWGCNCSPSIMNLLNEINAFIFFPPSRCLISTLLSNLIKRSSSKYRFWIAWYLKHWRQYKQQIQNEYFLLYKHCRHQYLNGSGCFLNGHFVHVKCFFFFINYRQRLY